MLCGATSPAFFHGHSARTALDLWQRSGLSEEATLNPIFLMVYCENLDPCGCGRSLGFEGVRSSARR
jgi:hypothetical protein